MTILFNELFMNSYTHEASLFDECPIKSSQEPDELFINKVNKQLMNKIMNFIHE